MTRKSKSMGPKFGVLGAQFGKDLRRFWGCFGTWEAPFGRWEGNLDTSALKRGGALFLTLPFWPEKCLPGARREVPREPEKQQKRRRRKRQEAT